MAFSIPSFLFVVLFALAKLHSNYCIAAILSRSQRDLLSFSMMATFKTGRSTMDFINYGRYCGILGSGSVMDSVDQCCKTHDQCYDASTDPGGVCEQWGRFGPYWITYKWRSFENGTVVCERQDMKVNRFADCGYEICKCDNVITSCFARHGYNPNNRKTLIWRFLESEITTRLNLTTSHDRKTPYS